MCVCVGGGGGGADSPTKKGEIEKGGDIKFWIPVIFYKKICLGLCRFVYLTKFAIENRT